MILDNLEIASTENSVIKIKVNPFIYQDGKNPRLPRKQSKGYTLTSDTNSFFSTVLSQINISSKITKFKVHIIINCGKDKLGKADLDNYSKAILDGITSSRKIWNDDKQIDELYLKRYYVNEDISNILIKIEQIRNEIDNKD
ncbi:RusA family crossover junction endodeoxyribonuclease [Mesonia ostreae]|uniref:RusA family crossover junction endodeoxyribonuclease n=1 Tax=Mesonia ostreae TaxID=861110 RepID=A0ABU2KMD2_9FLAO|nr:RusA family crossover junction endodeoxyribonuclease [Mesonia ostreae]MDT0295881.1 RusA family crossover junction endodeoxyribonuclease [Mesonia ostreae]